MEWDLVYKELKKRNLLVLLILSAISYFLLSSELTFGVLAGGVVVIINFHIFQHILVKAFSSEKRTRIKQVLLIIKSLGRLIVGGALLYLLIVSYRVHPVGLAIGFSTVFISIFSFGISNAIKLMMREAS